MEGKWRESIVEPDLHNNFFSTNIHLIIHHLNIMDAQVTQETIKTKLITQKCFLKATKYCNTELMVTAFDAVDER